MSLPLEVRSMQLTTNQAMLPNSNFKATCRCSRPSRHVLSGALSKASCQPPNIGAHCASSDLHAWSRQRINALLLVNLLGEFPSVALKAYENASKMLPILPLVQQTQLQCYTNDLDAQPADRLRVRLRVRRRGARVHVQVRALFITSHSKIC